MKVLLLTPLNSQNKEAITSRYSNLDFCFSSRDKLTQQEINECDILIGNPKTDMNLNQPNLKALLLNSAGSDRYIAPGILHPNTKLANATGAHSKAMAEHTIGMILAMNKNFRRYFDNMDSHRWFDYGSGKELYKSTVVIVGLGDIGLELAKRLKSFGCKIIGIKRTISELPKNVDELYTIEHLDEILPLGDFVISCLPHTKETIHLFNYERFTLMKEDASFINIGRGSAVNTADLKRALDEGRLHSVALDVVENEPLPKNDSLWDYDKVFITPHVSGSYRWPSAQDYFTSLVIRNLDNLLNNRPLVNEVDFKLGYAKK